MAVKRVNFNMAPECHALLKSVCALKGITVSDFCYELIRKDFKDSCRCDPQVRKVLLAGDYPSNSAAYRLKKEIMSEFPNE